MKRAILLVIVLIAACAEFGSAAKKPKQSGNRRPESVDPMLYCNACQAIVRETLLTIRESRRESDVIAALEHICRDRSFGIYEYPPPDMRRGCEAFMGQWTAVLERALVKRQSNDSIEQEICELKTKACAGVDMSQRQSQAQFMTVNDRQVPIGEDGKVVIGEPDL